MNGKRNRDLLTLRIYFLVVLEVTHEGEESHTIVKKKRFFFYSIEFLKGKLLIIMGPVESDRISK